MPRLTKLLNFTEQLSFYAAYHNNSINKLIHIVFVPSILWTVFVWLSNFPLFWIDDLRLVFDYPLVYGLAASYCAYYVLLEPFAGFLLAPVLLLLAKSAHLFLTMVPDANFWALVIHLTSWAFQFFGHFVFEKRAPALFDSLLQALLLAPMFVWIEVLFLFGYRPKLKARIDALAREDIEKYRREQRKAK